MISQLVTEGAEPRSFISLACKVSCLRPTKEETTPLYMNQTTTFLGVITWICRIAAALILLQTLFFKFTAAPESVYIFTKVGLEPWGRIGSGVVELIAAVLLLLPRFSWLGAAIALGVIGGAIISHLTVLGIVVMDDGGLLFGLAVITAICSAVVLLLSRRNIPVIGAFL